MLQVAPPWLSSLPSARRRRRSVWLLLGLLTAMLVSVDAAAQCTVTTDGTGTGLIFETCTESSSNGSQSVDVALPAGTVDGNLLIASVATDGTPTVTAPTGWTQIDIVAAGNSAAQLAVYYKIASSETGPYTFITVDRHHGDQQIAVAQRR